MANLGTPDSPTPSGVRAFLKAFLSDQRVVEIPKPIWQIILRLFILPFRPKRVAEAYASIWGENDSPIRAILLQQVKLTEQKIQGLYPDLDITFYPAMTYSKPSIHDVLKQLSEQPVDQIILLPLFPQYSATSTAPLFDAISKWTLKQRNLPAINMIRDYYQHPLFIKALASSVQHFHAKHGVPDKLLMSFHGIPQPFADKGDPYPERCHATAKAVAEYLKLTPEQWQVSFQSRFGAQEWVKPYTDTLLDEWATSGKVKSIQVLSPAFSADCLETLEELAIENKEHFLEKGGESYHYIPALNQDAEHIDLFVALLKAQLDAASQTFAH
ncbi:MULTISPECIES: ferrochelatase [unclassified Acinetobacter]|uniref:ferrochelatase n=1 Tax=unclassified Acinetobacter TaxID=196816 RepID=UPI0035B89590